ncbi:MAG: 4Fe-4S binding protein [Chloroflexota bacterium]
MRVEATHALCSGCRLCQLACSLNQFKENNPKKSAIVINSHLLEDGHYRVAVCDQCGICEEICPAGAVTKVAGAYQISTEECVWCLVCVQECPQEAMVIARGEQSPIKCVSCGDCVEICPTGALAMVD